MGEDFEKFEDVFYVLLEFGIVGMWGILGFGINWMNIYMVR